MSLRLKFIGAAETVTGSRYVLSTDHHHVLVDCGLFQGDRTTRDRNLSPLPISPREISAVVLTHAHIDHCGYLPVLAKEGFVGHVWCTEQTAALCAIALRDSAHLQEQSANHAGAHGRPTPPLYNLKDAEAIIKQLRVAPWHETRTIVEGVNARFFRAGHILGAASVQLDAGGARVTFSGDVGRPNAPVMKAAEPLVETDFLVVESTYGDRKHPAGDGFEDFAQIVKRTMDRRGVLIIPAFAIDRTEVVLHMLAQLKQRRALVDVPIFLNSPMGARVLDLYAQSAGEHRLSGAECAAMTKVAHVVESVEESMAIDARKGPMIIVAGSGMASGGRVVHHLARFASDPNNTILLVGYQANGTRGEQMVHGRDHIVVGGETIPVHADVQMIDAWSAHADADELLAWLDTLPRPPQKTFVTHGEPIAAEALALRISKRGWSAAVARNMQEVMLEGGAAHDPRS